MKKSPPKQHDEEDIVLDADSGEEIVAEEAELSEGQLKQKLKQLRAQLTQVQRERDENLAGWQRSKADLVNFRRMVEEDKVRDALRAKASLAEAIIPGLDSFESAMKGEHWSTMDAQWQKGVERIYEQLRKGLEREGFTTFGSQGDTFTPSLHECMSVVPPPSGVEDDTIVQVVQKGYSLGDEVIRPAKVIVAQS